MKENLEGETMNLCVVVVVVEGGRLKERKQLETEMNENIKKIRKKRKKN